MAEVTVSLPSDGQTIDASDYNTPITTIVNDYNGNIDNSNIASAAAIAGSKLADGGVTSAKLAEAFVRGRFQSITTNTAPTGLTIQAGWSYIQGAGANTANKTITFPVAFSTVYSVHITPLGLKSTSAPTAIGDLTTAYSGNNLVFIANSITNTTFSAAFALDSSATLANTLFAGFSWVAYGVV
jgi:hypothetical protein